jgi:hypothetical protein
VAILEISLRASRLAVAPQRSLPVLAVPIAAPGASLQNAKRSLGCLLTLAIALSAVSSAPEAAQGQSKLNPADLVGAWNLTATYSDDNRNGTLEEAERGKSLAAKDFLRLNADGSCEFYAFKLKGRYELETRSNGSQKLILFDKDNNKVDKGVITSVTKDELILLNVSIRAFSVYRRQ